MAMLMTRRDPFAEFDAMIRRAFPANPAFAGDKGVAVADFTPAAEIARDGNDAVIRLELPGLDLEKDISVELDKRSLVISGERRDERSAENAEESGTRILREIRYGSFRRSFALPEHVTAEALTAGYDAGVLTVRVTDAYQGPEPRKIAVNPGKPAVTADADTTVDADQAAE